MIELKDLNYVHLGASNPSEASKWAQDIYGLEEVARENGRIFLRGDDRNHNLCYFEGDPKDNTVGVAVADYAALDAAASHLEANGVEFTWGDAEGAAIRRVMKYLTFNDPTGNKFDLIVRPFHSGVRYFPSRDAGVYWFNHIGLKTSDAPRDEKFWTTVFNFTSNDWIGDAPLMSFDNVHHRFALFPTDHAGVQHINFQVRETDDIMRSSYFLQDRQERIVFGPGRHATSGARFLYFEGPDGMVYEYSCGVRMIEPDDDWRPRQFPFTPESFCVWGSKPDIPEFRE
ncbi:MAG: VOC family protein [Rickettsiales bacterium]|jgi:2,3-dihydroxy-p-cumate/2,3-dihydroxybenzoate 3,4-dioxygenase